ncbi:MAG: diaminopimelate epimerase, partial [Lysobacterales bacterium]
MALRFHKMHGLGNDFVVLDLRDQDFAIDAGTAARLADRHYGIGCDQVLVLRQPRQPGQLAAFEVWNADG